MKLSLSISLLMTAFLLTTACNAPATEKTPKTVETVQAMVAKPDMAKVKAEIQALENAYADSDNANNANAIAALYTDDAVSLNNHEPMSIGKAAILKSQTAGMAKKKKGTTVTYDIMDVYGDENQVTEVGKFIRKDAAGKVERTGKYMAVWEKRDGKYLCVRDISNNDAKEVAQ